MSMEEYEDLKYESREEIRELELELENARLRKENEELAREIFRLKTQNEEDLFGQSPIRKSVKPASKGGFFF